MAREGARWAAVHGRDYSEENGKAVTTPADVYNNAIKPMAAALDSTKLNYSVTWDDASERPTYLNASNNPKKNNVRVTVSYTWVPELYFRSVTLSSTAIMPVTY